MFELVFLWNKNSGKKEMLDILKIMEIFYMLEIERAILAHKPGKNRFIYTITSSLLPISTSRFFLMIAFAICLPAFSGDMPEACPLSILPCCLPSFSRA